MPNYRCRAVLLTVVAIAAGLVYASTYVGAKNVHVVQPTKQVAHAISQRRSVAAFKAPKSALEKCQAVCRRGKILRAVVVKADHALARSGRSNSPLRRQLVGIVKAARAAGISPFFLLSIAGQESSFGLTACDGNAWGYNMCNTTFKTFIQGAGVVAKDLKDNYNLDTIYVVAKKYCPGTYVSWAGKVGSFMTGVFRVNQNGLRWQDAVQEVK